MLWVISSLITCVATTYPVCLSPISIYQSQWYLFSPSFRLSSAHSSESIPLLFLFFARSIFPTPLWPDTWLCFHFMLVCFVLQSGVCVSSVERAALLISLGDFYPPVAPSGNRSRSLHSGAIFMNIDRNFRKSSPCSGFSRKTVIISYSRVVLYI